MARQRRPLPKSWEKHSPTGSGTAAPKRYFQRMIFQHLDRPRRQELLVASAQEIAPSKLSIALATVSAPHCLGSGKRITCPSWCYTLEVTFGPESWSVGSASRAMC